MKRDRNFTREQKIKLAKRLIELNLDIDQISEIVELDKKELQKILKG